MPVTLVRHRDTPLDGTAPALFYGYGAYEATFDPLWDAALPSLLDAGVVFALVQVRGGGEGGRRWWLQGHLGHKQNAFTDHIAVADGLAGLVDGSRLGSRGLSAGGLHDPRVMVHEPAKWVAALRDSDPEWSPRCLFRCETGAGAHGGPSGRFARLDYEAEGYAWLLDKLLATTTDSSVSSD